MVQSSKRTKRATVRIHLFVSCLFSAGRATAGKTASKLDRSVYGAYGRNFIILMTNLPFVRRIRASSLEVYEIRGITQVDEENSLENCEAFNRRA